MVQLCRGLQTNTHLEEFGLGLRACTSQIREVIYAMLAINSTLKRLWMLWTMERDPNPDVRAVERGFILGSQSASKERVRRTHGSPVEFIVDALDAQHRFVSSANPSAGDAGWDIFSEATGRPFTHVRL